MNKIDKIISKNKEDLRLVVKREFNFNKEKSEKTEEIAKDIKLLENSNLFNIDGKEFEYQKMFREGNVTGLIVKGRALFDMNKHARAFARENTMIVKGDKDSIVHESEHILQNLLGLVGKFDRWELEHDAYLVEVMLSENSKASLKKLSKEIRGEVSGIHCDFNDMKSLYNIQIGLPNIAGKWSFVYTMSNMLLNIKRTDESVKHACKILLNEKYKNRIGITYDELIKKIEE